MENRHGHFGLAGIEVLRGEVLELGEDVERVLGVD